MRGGAHAYLNKGCSPDVLFAAIAKVAGGGAFLAGLGVTFFLVNQKAEATDPATWCNRAGPAEVHLILLDASDPLDGVQAETARAKVVSAIRAALKRKFDLSSMTIWRSA